MLTMTNQNQQPFLQGVSDNLSSMDDENRVFKKIKQSPLLPVATLGFLGLGGYRIYTAGNRGGQKLSFYLIHTRLAAQGLAVGVLGTIVLYSLGQRFFNSVTHQNSEEER